LKIQTNKKLTGPFGFNIESFLNPENQGFSGSQKSTAFLGPKMHNIFRHSKPKVLKIQTNKKVKKQ
jgi:hypothetical protein